MWHIGKDIHCSIVCNNKKWYPKYPLVGDWLNTVWYSHTMKDYKSLKNNSVAVYALTEKDLEGHTGK